MSKTPSPSPKKDNPNESTITIILDSSGECDTRDESSTLLLDDNNMDVDEKTSEELEKEFQMELQDSAEKQDKKEEKENNKSPANKKRRMVNMYESPQGMIKDVTDMFGYLTKNKKTMKKKGKEEMKKMKKDQKKLKF